MKFKIQKSKLELTLESSNLCKTRVLFSFENKLLNNAKKHGKDANINELSDLEGSGSITVITNDKNNLLVSLGAKEKFNLAKYQESLHSLGIWLNKNSKVESIDIILEEQIAILIYADEESYAEQTIFHLVNSMYYFDELKSKRKTLSLKKINFVGNTTTSLENAIALLEGVFLVKDLGNNPANIATPSYLAKTAEYIATRSKKTSVKILHKKELKELGMSSFLAVAKGSDEEPKLVTLSYNGGKATDKPIVLVGKGVTFDSGGISIKPRSGMNEMKYDMMGAATALGVFLSAVKLNLPINLVMVAPCTENLISGVAVKPGDIVKSMSGQTIEILNTDAEGRLILCDALTYVERFNPELVIDMATLTGACITAIGHAASGLYSNDDTLCEELIVSSIRSNDKVWHMPLFDEYEDGLKSSIADMANIDNWNGIAGSPVAAKFLSKFVKYKWAHLDIAGTAWKSGFYDGNTSNGGATGRPFGLIIDFLRNHK